MLPTRIWNLKSSIPPRPHPSTLPPSTPTDPACSSGFSKNVDKIIEHFNCRATIGLVVRNSRLAPILNHS